MQQLYLKTRTQWRDWLFENHNRATGVWLVFYKKATGVQSLDYEDVVEEALCFGWVDSLIKNLDQRRYARKVTPRNADSKWSAANMRRVDKLIKQGSMTEAGMQKIISAKKFGHYRPARPPKLPVAMPAELEQALGRHKRASEFFHKLAPSYQRHYTGWVALAKRPGTRIKRARESIRLLDRGKRLGLK